MQVTSKELRDKYLKFFESKGHAIIKSASLIPENDPTVLFTTAGMHPLVPYLLGEKHPAGTRLCNVQKCVRTGDIEEVGDISHCTFFEMLGNWSLGDYFKKEAIAWSFEFLTDEKYLNLPLDKLAVSVFAGDENAPRDEESAKIWQDLGILKNKIFYLPKEHNWWGPAGTTGPCGPDTEMFIDLGENGCTNADCGPSCDCKRYIEIWNDVFMQYFKDENANYKPLAQKNVDTGMGLERTLVVLNGYESVYQTDLFANAQKMLEDLTGKKYGSDADVTKSFRIILDHTRTATFMIGDQKGISPSNVDQGYVLRRIIRRAVRYGRNINLPDNSLKDIALTFVEKYKDIYPELEENKTKIITELQAEEERFSKTLTNGLKEFEKVINSITMQSRIIALLVEFLKENNAFTSENAQKSVYNALCEGAPYSSAKQAIELLQQKNIVRVDFNKQTTIDFGANNIIDGAAAFRLYDTYGFPIEITCEMAKEKGFEVDVCGFDNAFLEHQKKSQTGSLQRFKGGLSDNHEQTARLHTATHLLLAGLKQILSPDINQKGSNITAERLRFDFNFARPLTEQEIKEIQEFVNGAIAKNLPVTMQEMSMEQATKEGAVGVFEDKYGQMVKVYAVKGYSKEICGGPHAQTTGELGRFVIQKEQSSSAGVRRIRAVLENN